MTTNNVYLRNTIALDLNFLLFTNNIYKSTYTETIRFPGKSDFKKGLLSYNEFSEALKKSWNCLSLRFNDPALEPVNEILVPQVEFLWLFQENDEGKKMFVEVWESFNLWWWPSFGIKSFMERVSDPLVVTISEEVARLAHQYGYSIPVEQLSLVVVFEQPPCYCIMQHSHLYIASLAELFHSKNIGSISNKLLENIVNASTT